jgi:hypothetical protein
MRTRLRVYWQWLLLVGCLAFLGCIGVSFERGRRVVPPPEPPPATPSTKPEILTQSGKLVLLAGQIREVYYPVPYYSQPVLKVSGPSQSFTILEQQKDRFKITATLRETDSLYVEWESRGRPITVAPPGPVGVPPVTEGPPAVTPPTTRPPQPLPPLAP